MENSKEIKSKKSWEKLNNEQKNHACLILKNKLIYNQLIPSDTSIEDLKSFLQTDKPSVIVHFQDDKETVLCLNKAYSKNLMQNMQLRFIKETGFDTHKEYIIDVPKGVNIDEIIKSKKQLE